MMLQTMQEVSRRGRTRGSAHPVAPVSARADGGVSGIPYRIKPFSNA